MFLTGRKEEEDVLGGYDLGADDYVTKPFSPSVLKRKNCGDPETYRTT